MKNKYLLALVLSLLCLRAADQNEVADSFFPPEMVMMAAGEIGLSNDVQQKLREHLTELEPRFKDFQTTLEKEQKELLRLSAPAKVDQNALLVQLDKVIAAERQLRHLQLKTLSSIKNHLTPAQQDQLRQLKKNHGADYAQKLQKRLEGKVRNIEEGMHEWQSQGKDPSPIAVLMQDLPGLMQNGQVKEAEALLDRILQRVKNGE